MADDPAKGSTDESPVEKDARQPIAGRQPQRPGQDGRYQPHPGERDPETLKSADPEGFAGEDATRAVIPTAQKPRRGEPQRSDDPDER